MLGNQGVEVKHIFLGTVVCFNDRDAPFFELLYILMVVPFEGMQIFQIIPHFYICLLVFQKQSCPHLAKIADDCCGT